MNVMLLGYARVSSFGQSLESQIDTLINEGVNADHIFKEKISGKSTDQRIELKRLIEYAREGDTILVTKIDRLGRSIIDLNNIVQDLASKGVAIRFIDDNITFEGTDNSAMNTLVFNMLGSFAQFERDLIAQRTAEGRERAKAQGKHLGRPARPQKDVAKAVELFHDRTNNGLSVNDIVRLTGVPRSTIYREVKRV